SGDPAPTGSFSVDDAMVLTVTRPDGSVVTWSRVFEVGCYAVYPSGPVDITSLFRAGVNTVSIRLYDVCGWWEGNWPIFLTYTPATADLSITNSASPNPATVGTNLTYTIDVTNNGPSPATGVTLTDTLPSGVLFRSVSSSQGSCTGMSTITCSLGSLANGASATVTVVVRPKGPQTITNMATVSAGEPDANAANNTATIGIAVGPPEPDFSPAPIAAASASMVTLREFLGPEDDLEFVRLLKLAFDVSLCTSDAAYVVYPVVASGGALPPNPVPVNMAQ
ncbi:MAG: DUF11 domain-containing protein, partial [Chloroflexi bacterium]|nr:DUF11 domain-containing protein [Chloroflexota bacterium]